MQTILQIAIPALAMSVALPATAQERSTPFRGSASATGSYVTGNLSQAQLLASLGLSRSTKKSGYDLLGSAFRMWIRPAAGEPFLRIGDTMSATALPFRYLGDKPFVLGTARYEHSQLRGVTGRINAGAAMGIAPVRQETRLLRLALGAQLERTQYTVSELSPEWVEATNPRLVPRIAVQSNGWTRLPSSRLRARYVGALLVNPTQPTDLRWFLDVSTDLQIAQQWSFRVSFSGLHDAVNPSGVLPTDLRTTAGVAWSTQASRSKAD